MVQILKINPKRPIKSGVVVTKPPVRVVKQASPAVLQGAYGPNLGRALTTNTATVAKATPMTASEKALMSVIRQYQSAIPSMASTRATAAKSVQDQIDEALAGSRASAAADQMYYNQQAKAAQQFAKGVNAYAPINAEAVQADYRQAAGDIANLGYGLTGAVHDVQQQQADKAVADFAARGGLGTAPGSVDLAGATNAAAYLGATAPASNLYAEAANQAAAARYGTAINAEHVRNIAADYLQQAAQSQHELALQRTALEAKRPGLYDQALQDALTSRRQDLATVIQGLALQNTMAGTQSQITSREVNDMIDKALLPYTQAGKAAQTAGTKASTAATKAKTTTATNAALNLDNNGNPKQGYHWNSTDPKTRKSIPIPSGYTIDKNDPTQTRIVKDPTKIAKGAGAGKKGTSQSEIRQRGATVYKAVLGAPYAKNTQDPALKQYTNPHWVAQMPKAEMRKRLLLLFPADVRKLPQVQAFVDTAMGRIDEWPGAKTTATAGPPVSEKNPKRKHL